MKILNKFIQLAEKVLTFYFRIKPKKTFWSVAVPYFLFILGWIGNHIEQLVQFLNNQYGDSETFIERLLWGLLTIWVSIDLPIWSVVLITVLFIPFGYLYFLELKAKKEGVNLDEKISSYLSELNKDLDEKIDDLKSEISFQISDEWIEEQCSLSITELGNRYTPKLNVELDISHFFEGLGRTCIFKEHIEESIDDFLVKGKKILNNKKEISHSLEDLNNNLESFVGLYNSINFLGNEKIPVSEIEDNLVKISVKAENIKRFYLDEETKLQKENKEYRIYQKYGTEISNIRDFQDSLYDLRQSCNSKGMQLANSPLLLLIGEAGIGKSHLLGDVVSNRKGKDYESVFLLGQHFVTDEDPWTQIFKKLNINISKGKFLEQLNNRSQQKNQRCIIFIDAINEGRGRYFWHKNIKSFISELLKYEWLGLVLSVRSSYQNLIFPKGEFDEFGLIEVTHYGFRNVEYEASKLFFNNYAIELPSVPLLHPEFENPLFLKLFCEGLKKAGLNKIPGGFHGISKIISFFINSVNLSLSKPDRLDYSDSVNLVQKSIDALIEYKITNTCEYIPYETAFLLIDSTASDFIKIKGFIDELISEGVLSKNLFWKTKDEYEEGVYLAYERFDDHLTAKYLLDCSSNIELAFTEKGDLFEYVKDGEACNVHKGIIDSFSIQIPELIGREFYDLVPHLKDKYPIVEAFVLSLLWRRHDSFADDAVDYVNKCVLSYKATHNLFLEVLFTITAVPGHFFNAEFLHKNLLKFSLSDRDEWWTQELKNKFDDYSTVKRLIDWGWKDDDKTHISNDSVFLSCITLSWFHTTTNRQLRDSATKAMVCLLQNRIDVLINVLRTFEGVNDPYVYERLFAVALGCTLRTNQKNKLLALSEYIFETIFYDKEEVYPHILLRDYARTIIEFTSYLGYKLPFDIKLSCPPYKSILPDTAMSIEEIDEKYEFDYKSAEFKKHYWSQNSILSSMTTEYGRGTSMYGDFGRYVFQSALRDWEVSADMLSNLAVEWIFEKYGYDVEKHGEYDRNLDSYGRASSNIERIGKKYQWIAFYEILARVSDNCKKYEGWGKDKKKVQYQGAFEPYVRDIDPTMIIKETPAYNPPSSIVNHWWSKEHYSNWDIPNKEWINHTEDLPISTNLINVVDNDGNDWLVLEGYPEWSQPKKLGEEKWGVQRKQLWYQIRSYIVKSGGYEKTKNWMLRQDFMGRWMPESSTRYELFSREYYWSSAFNYFSNEYYGGSEWSDIYDKKSGKFIDSVIVTAINFHWEEEFDRSKEETISYLKPCSQLFSGMGLFFSKKEGDCIDNDGRVICFDPSVFHGCKSFLLVKKAPLLEYLNKNDLKLIWTILGEKQIIGGGFRHKDYVGRMEVSGCFYLDDSSRIDGVLNTKIE